MRSGRDKVNCTPPPGGKRIKFRASGDGASNAVFVAEEFPEYFEARLVRRLVLVSAAYATDGFYSELLSMQAKVGAEMLPAMKETPMYRSYIAIAPKPDDFPKLLDRMGEWLRRPYDWSEDVKNLTMPVMLIYGDGDAYRPEHIVKFYQLLGGGLKDAGWQREHMSKNRLVILPDLTHYDIFLAPELMHTALPFLNRK